MRENPELHSYRIFRAYYQVRDTILTVCLPSKAVICLIVLGELRLRSSHS